MKNLIYNLKDQLKSNTKKQSVISNRKTIQIRLGTKKYLDLLIVKKRKIKKLLILKYCQFNLI